MALFFLLVGLEIKREFLDGSLATWDRRRLPLIAAAAGMAAPALLYLAVAGGDAGASPAAGRSRPRPTSPSRIGVLALLGRRAPTSLKLFLTTVAIADDLGAVAIIALAYTDRARPRSRSAPPPRSCSPCSLHGRRAASPRLWLYLIGAACLWYAVLLSGVHADRRRRARRRRDPAGRDARRARCGRLAAAPARARLSPWVAFADRAPVRLRQCRRRAGGIGPGARAGAAAARHRRRPVPRQAGGHFRRGLARRSASACAARPRGATWLQIYGMSLLCGIGFTMSLFIGALAFPGRPAARRGGQDRHPARLAARRRWPAISVLRFAPPRHERPRRKRLTSLQKAEPLAAVKAGISRLRPHYIAPLGFEWGIVRIALDSRRLSSVLR